MDYLYIGYLKINSVLYLGIHYIHLIEK